MRLNVADFILGQAYNFTQDGGIYMNLTGIKWSAFVQDNWRATKRLTINAGLRWDPFIPYQDSEGRLACYEPGQQSQRFPNAPEGLLFGGSNHDPGCPASSIQTTLGNFAPRLGFAYKLTDDNKTSIRGGAGIYYEIPDTVTFQDVVGIPPFAPIISLTDVNFGDPFGSAGVPNPFPSEFGGLNKSVPSTVAFPPGPYCVALSSPLARRDCNRSVPARKRKTSREIPLRNRHQPRHHTKRAQDEGALGSLS
jgi:hypothetical protein